MYKNIILPIDLGHKERAGAMLTAAKAVADKDARFFLVHVIDQVPAYIASQLPEELHRDRLRIAATELEKLAAGAGVNATVVTAHGHAADNILKAADDNGADIIIIASHKPGFQDYLIGSTAGRVVRHSKCSVLVIR